jgi:hypothetical protein
VDPWLEDLKFHFARALRAVGLGLAAVAWASALSSEAQQSADARTVVQVAAAIAGVCVSQWFTGLPPSATGVDLLQPFERDIRAVAREQARGNPEHMQFLLARITAIATFRIRGGARLPAGARRDWVRALGRLVDHSDET